jgi:hypothetical protein
MSSKIQNSLNSKTLKISKKVDIKFSFRIFKKSRFFSIILEFYENVYTPLYQAGQEQKDCTRTRKL